jgi:predicted Fe-Mo cluster-binding NifX family protein
MVIAFTAMENSLEAAIDPRFGRAAFYIIVNTVTDEVTIHDNSDGINASNGAGTGAAQTLSEYGVEELYTGRVGPKAADVLDKAGIRYYENITGTVQDALNRIKSGQFSPTTANTPQPVESPAACPGALPTGAGYRIAGQGRGMGRGGRGAGRGQGMGRGRGMCHR